MFKLAGILLLMAGCAGLGFERVAEEKRRINELREMRRMIVRRPQPVSSHAAFPYALAAPLKYPSLLR